MKSWEPAEAWGCVSTSTIVRGHSNSIVLNEAEQNQSRLRGRCLTDRYPQVLGESFSQWPTDEPHSVIASRWACGILRTERSVPVRI